jgi:antitoxin FitA
MGQILVRNLSDKAIDTFKFRAKMKGTSLEQEVRELIESRSALTPAEKVAISRWLRSQTKGIAEPLTLDEIREGLE